MPEYLVITKREDILEAVEQLRREGYAIEVEKDFTRGLKSIFYRLPDATFIQQEIDGLCGDRVAMQVRRLLEDESLRLLLMADGGVDALPEESPFDGSIDSGLPFDKLLETIRGELQGGGEGDVAKVEEFFESNPSPPGEGGEDDLDPFCEFFPADIHHNWGSIITDTAAEPHVAEEGEGSAVSEPHPFTEFSFEPPGEIVSSIPTIPGGQVGRSSPPPPVPRRAGETELVEPGEARISDKESPHRIFASMSDDAPRELPPPMVEDAGAELSMESRLRLKGVITQRSLQKTAAGAGKGVIREETPPEARDEGKKRPRPVEPGDVVASPLLKKTGMERKPVVRWASALLVLAASLSAFLIIQRWDDLWGVLFRSGREVVTSPPLPKAPPRQKLPPFVPRVGDDAAYSSSHPGWERYLGDGMEFLIYRERGRILAIQVVAATDGKISDGFLDRCIAESTGGAPVEGWVKEERDGFLVEKGRLAGKGEVAVYRKMPNEEIRGFVVTLE